MKKKYILLATTLFLLPAVSAIAADDSDVSGSLELGVRALDDQDNSAKYHEYRDIDDGVFGSLNLDYFTTTCYFGVEGDKIGQDDQSFLLNSGTYGKYDFSLFYDEIPHNLSFGARSFYTGIGTNNLTINMNPDNLAAWNTFDYTADRKSYGADVEFSFGSPFFVNVGVSREEKDGVKPLGSGSFSGQVEMPEPLDYETDNLVLAGGFRSTEIMFKVTGMLSSFDNNNKFLSWTNPFNGAAEVNSLPPDNDYGKVGAKLTWRQLPMMSTLLVNGSYSNISNDFSITDVNMSSPSGLNRMTFDGDVSYTNLSASFVSHPMERLGTRLFYYYLDKDNDSSVITYMGGGNATHIFGYTKNNAGIEADYDLGMDTKLSAGYEFKDIDRTNRHDAEKTKDNMVFIKAKNSSLDIMTAKLEYTYLNRDADKVIDQTLTPNDAAYITRFIDRFDAASKKMNEIKLILEFYPMDNFDVGLEYAYVNNDYDEAILGRKEDKGHEIYLDLMWRATETFHLNGFAGYEKYDADSDHYNHRAGFQGQTADPTVEDGNPSSFVWTRSLDDNFWNLGLMGQLGLMQDQLKLSLSCQYQKSDGETDLSQPLKNIDKVEDYDITTVEAKAIYALADNLDVTLGYVYEESEYEDLQYIGYEYHPSGSYLSGAYADHDYETHLGYLKVKYTF